MTHTSDDFPREALHGALVAESELQMPDNELRRQRCLDLIQHKEVLKARDAVKQGQLVMLTRGMSLNRNSTRGGLRRSQFFETVLYLLCSVRAFRTPLQSINVA